MKELKKKERKKEYEFDEKELKTKERKKERKKEN